MAIPKICVVGSSNQDLFNIVDEMPLPGETIHGKAFFTSFGGKGANQAVMAAKLGAEVSMITRIGNDSFGKDIKANFRAQRMKTEKVFVTENTATGIAVICVDKKGENSIIVTPGANALLSEKDIDAAYDVIAKSALLLCQLEVPIETVMHALKIARKNNVRTILNASPVPKKFNAEFFRLANVMCLNEIEAAAVSGCKTASMKGLEKAALEILKKGTELVVITLGAKGCLVASGKNSMVHIPAPKVNAVDTTGAGDCFLGSLSYFLAAGKEIHEAAKRSSAISAESVKKKGTQISYPERKDLSESLFD